MAEVFAVEDPSSGEHFACKLLVAIKHALKRFNREYEAMTRLNHPNIVRVYHYGLHEGHPWLTMELLTGTPAQAWAKNAGKPGSKERTDEVLRMSIQLARALQYIHDRGLVHRDLKSANVLVLPDSRVKLVDFGTAHLYDAAQAITQDGEFVGTFAYASPEQVSGRPIDGRSDLYSFGVLLYRLLTGRRPFASVESAALIHAHLTQPPPDPRIHVPELDERLVGLLFHLLAKAPEDRPQQAEQVATLMEAILGKGARGTAPLVLHRARCTNRDLLHRELQAHLQSAPGAAALVVGDDGSDRRRIVDDMLAAAAERGVRVFHCNLAEGADVQSLMGMLKVIGRQGADNKAVRALRKITRANDTQLAMDQVRQTLRNSVLSTLKGFAEKSEVLLGAHGLEHASPLTLEVLAGVRAAAAERGIPVGLVASCSAVALIAQPEIKRRLADAPVFELEPLTPNQVAQAVGGMLGRRPPPAEVSRRLHEATDGQPAYLEAAVRDLLASGVLEADDGNRVEWAGSRIAIELPEQARKDAMIVLGTQPVLHRRFLEAMALLDEEVRLDLLGESLEWEADEVLEVANRVVEGQVLRWAHPNVLAWRQSRLRALVMTTVPAARRRVHETRLAKAIRPYAPSPAQVRLLLAAGDPVEASSRGITAARQALLRHDYRTALSILAPVVAQSANLPPQARAEANLLYARCLEILRPLDPGATRSLAEARKVEGSPLTAEIELAAAGLAGAIGHFANNRKFLDAAWVAAESAKQATLMSEIALEIAESCRQRGQFVDSTSWIEKARKAAIASGSRSVMGESTLASARLHLAHGEMGAAEKVASKAMQFFEREANPVGFWRSVPVWTETLRRQGRFSEALAVLTVRCPEAREGDDPAVYVRMLMSVAACELDLCRLGRAQEVVDEIVATVRRGERMALRLEAKMLDGRIRLASGQLLGAAFLLQDTMDRAKAAGLTLIAERARGYYAETIALLGETSKAGDLYRSATLGLMGMGDRLALSEVCTSRSRALHEDPAVVFKPVEELLESEPLPALKVELLLARAAWSRRQSAGRDTLTQYRDAARALNQLAAGLNDTDRAALRVHPWSRRIREGLG